MTEQEQKAFNAMREALEHCEDSLQSVGLTITASIANEAITAANAVQQAQVDLSLINEGDMPQPTEPAWRLIESAPKDGTEIIGCWPSYIDIGSFARVTCKYVGWAWVTTDYSETELAQPTYWMPLPSPPEAPHE